MKGSTRVISKYLITVFTKSLHSCIQMLPFDEKCYRTPVSKIVTSLTCVYCL